MNKVVISLPLLFSLLFSSNLFSAEYIIKIKQGHKLSSFLKKQAIRQFKILGKEYIIIEKSGLEEVQAVAKLEEVDIIENNFEVHTLNNKFYSPNVSDFKKQWGLRNNGKNEPVSLDRMSPLQGVVGADINTSEAWKITKGSKKVIIAVIDTGVDWKHPELKANMWQNIAEKNGRAGVDDDGNGFVDDIYGYDFISMDSDPKDLHGHGTHVAGIIGASHNSGKVAGVMANVSIMAVRMLNKKGRGNLEKSLMALGYAIENGAHILSNSWGSSKYSKIMEELFKEAAKKEIIVVAAAGNSRFNNNDTDPIYPASYPVSNIISVSAFNAQERHSSYSSFGKKSVHIAAPGTNVISTFIKKRRSRDIYKVASGTSMSAPFVSGIIGLFLSHTKVKLSPEEIRKRLIDSAVPVSHIQDMNVAGGRVDALKFLTH